mgnify:CR=1 FL=1
MQMSNNGGDSVTDTFVILIINSIHIMVSMQDLCLKEEGTKVMIG